MSEQDQPEDVKTGSSDTDLAETLEKLVDELVLPTAPTVAHIRRRAGARRRRRMVAGTAALAGVVILAVAGSLSTRPGPMNVRTADAAGEGSLHRLGGSDGNRAWEWYSDAGIVGRDGSASGFALSTAPGSTGLVIILGDGTPCLDPTSCEQSVDHFDYSEFEALFDRDSPAPLIAGDLPADFDVSPATLSEPGSPFAATNLVWLPQTTGDMHLGARPDADIAGLDGVQQFVGQRNVEKLLTHLKKMPFVPELTDVTLVGPGTGGFGALGNYRAVETAFDDQNVALLVDTAPWFHPGTALSRCEANEWTSLWGLKRPSSWPDDLAAGPDSMGNIYAYLAGRYPHADLGFMVDNDDAAIRTLYSHTYPDCRGRADVDGSEVSPSEYSNELSALITELNGLDNWRTLNAGTGSQDRPLVRVWTNPTSVGTDTFVDFVDELLRP